MKISTTVPVAFTVVPLAVWAGLRCTTSVVLVHSLLTAAAVVALTLDGREVGRLTTVARHHVDGPIALALIKRNVAVDADLVVDSMPAAQEVVVDPEVGLHVRPNR